VPKIYRADESTGGDFEHYGACAFGVIAPAPVRHALSNRRRAGETKKVTGSKRRNINDCATVAQDIMHISDR
jgi:hypothetical protein